MSSGDVPAVTTGGERQAVEQLLEDLDVETNNYRLGNTQVFLRSGIISQFEDERYERLGDKIVSLQAYCRGYLARRSSRRLRSQDLAIRCIQKNVRKFVGVRDWAWWRLLIKVTPLLNVHRTEEQLKAREDEVDKLRARLDKLEAENKELKVKLGEGVYSGEHNGLTVLLDVEAYDYGYRPATGTGVYMVLNHHGDKPILSSGRVDLQVAWTPPSPP